MLTPEEKERIIERVKFEEKIRGELGHPDKQPSSRWNSKIALLLIGSLITGVLVPWFQFIQNRLAWRRQNAFEHTQFRLKTARDCLNEFVILQVYLIEVLERGRLLKETVPVESAEAAQLMEEFVGLRVKLSQQSARVLSLIMYFDKAEKIRSYYQDHMVLTSVNLNKVSGLISDVCRASESEAKTTDLQKRIAEVLKEIEGDMDEFQRLYTEIINAMRTEIGRLEDERLPFL
jgi:hypothetical protein